MARRKLKTEDIHKIHEWDDAKLAYAAGHLIKKIVDPEANESFVGRTESTLMMTIILNEAQRRREMK